MDAPLVWHVCWTWATGGEDSTYTKRQWQDLLEGGLMLQAPDRWLGLPVRHAWSRTNGKWRRSLERDMAVPTGSASPFDPYLLDRSVALMQSRMVRRGFLDGGLSIVPETTGDKVELEVMLAPGRQYACGSAEVKADSSGLSADERAWLDGQWNGWKGQPLDLDRLERERERLSTELQSRGWFGLLPDFLTITIDTTGSRGNGKVHLTLNVLPPTGGTAGAGHRVATFDSLTFHWHPLQLQAMETQRIGGFWWRIPEGRDVRGLAHRMQLNPGQPFNPRALSDARQAIRQLPLVQDVRMDIRPMEALPEATTTPLHVHIDAYPSERRVMRVNGAITSRQGPGGELALSLSDQDFRARAERIALDFGIGIETVTPYGPQAEDGADVIDLFNSRILSAGMSYGTGRLFPYGPDRFPKSNRPESAINFTFRDENRPKFNRTYIQLGMVEKFVENQAKGSRIELRPFEVALTSSRLQPGFQQDLDSLGSDILTSSFESRALFGSGIHWQLHPTPKDRGSIQWNLDLEWEGAGNLYHLLDGREPDRTTIPLPSAFGRSQDIQVARYTRWILDVRAGWSPDRKNGLFARGFIGVAASSIGDVAVPLEKQFYVGGPNSMRGWQALGLGPGGTQEVGLRVRGDIRMEVNIEGRRYLNDWVQLAAFVDAGNIWMTRPEENRPDVHWTASGFLDQTAISAGAGIRLDFGYFILRCDAGRPIRWPDGAQHTEQRWRIHPAVSLPF